MTRHKQKYGLLLEAAEVSHNSNPCGWYTIWCLEVIYFHEGVITERIVSAIFPIHPKRGDLIPENIGKFRRFSEEELALHVRTWLSAC